MKIVEHGAIINAVEAGGLQEAFDALPEAGGAIYVPAGKYEIDETVRYSLSEQQHVSVYGDGRASVITFTATDGSHFLELDGVENSWWPDLKITIRDLTLVGNYECGDALHLRWPNDALVDSCFFQGFGGCAVVVTPQATNVTVRDCWMRDCKRAMHADNLHHLTFHGNQTRSATDGQKQNEHVYIGRHCREVRIVNNHLAYGHAEAIILDGTAQHVIANNTIEGFTHGIRARDCRDIAISNNYLHCPTGICMEEDNRGISICGNIMTANSAGAVRITGANGSGLHVISGNVIRQSVYEDGQQGIDVGDAENCIVTGNVVEDLSSGDAISGGGSGTRADGNLVNDTGERARKSADAKRVELDKGNQYVELYAHLKNQPASCVRRCMGFGELVRIMGHQLPDEAYESRSWWANDASTEQARAWLAAGWVVSIVKRIETRVVFVRQ